MYALNRMAMMISRSIATPPRTTVIMIFVLVREALDSSSGRSEEEAGIGVTESVTVGPVVEKVEKEIDDLVVVKVLDSVTNEVVFAEGLGLGPGPGPVGVELKDNGGDSPPGNPPAVAVVIARSDIHSQCFAASNRF
jgi:hypothetical protein